MGRPRKAVPDYRFHISGQAVVTLAGKDFYLGPHDSPESRAKYLNLVTEYQRNGHKAPDASVHQSEEAVTITGLVADFRVNGLERLTPSGNHRREFDRLCETMVDEYGDDAANNFGPRKLEEIRSLFVASGNCRRWANSQAGMIRRIFKWAVSRELIEPSQLVALDSLEPLKRGEAPDNDPRQPAKIQTVELTLPLLDKVVTDMIRLQLATGCRPSELFSLVPAEVDRSGEVWMIRKGRHKTAHHGKRKIIPLVGNAQKLLMPYLLRDHDQFCFLNRRGTPWNKDTYRRHVTRKCDDNGIERWTPYQIRHLVGQTVRDTLSAEHTQAILGHSRISMIETYSRASEAKAIEAAKAIQNAS